MQLNYQKKDTVVKTLVVIYLIIYVAIMLFTIGDYGWSYDDGIQRFHSLVSYKYVNKVIFKRNLNDFAVFENIPELNVYENKYYGVALQLPFVFIEDLFHFTLSTRHIFMIRHIGIGLMCCAGYFIFYKFITCITNSRLYGFVGLVLISLYPRFYGEKFFNIKDQVFVATCCLAYWGIYLYLSHMRKLRYGLLAGCFFAVSTCSRMMGAMFPVILIGYLVISDIWGKKYTSNKILLKKGIYIPGVAKCFIDYISIAGTYFLVWYIGTPVAWFKNVFKEFYRAFTYFSYYDAWEGTSVFAGQTLHFSQMPWYYIFVWIGITVPLIYIVLFCVGHCYIYRKDTGIKNWFARMLTDDKYISLAIAMFWGPCVLVALHMIKIYTAWRHMFFLMCPLIMLAVFGLKYFIEEIHGKYAGKIRNVWIGIFAASMIVQIVWIVHNHPYQYVYFNLIGKPVASQYDRDYFRATAYDLLEYIFKNDDRNVITIDKLSDIDKEFVYLSDSEKERLRIVEGNGDYVVICYRNVVGNDYCPEGYHEVYSIVVDGTKMGTVFRSNTLGEYSSARENTIDKSENSILITQGKASYTVGHRIDDKINLDTWMVQKGKILGNTVWKGTDIEGPIKLEGADDFIGGIHGDEHYTDVYFLLDGVVVEEDELIGTRRFEDFVMYVESDLYFCDSDQLAFHRTKKVEFKENKVIISNKLEYLADEEHKVFRWPASGIYSVYKEYMIGYDTNYDCTLIDDTGTEENRLIDTVCFYGNNYTVTVRALSEKGDCYAGWVQNFESRFKAYLDTINNSMGEFTLHKGDVLNASYEVVVE